MGGHIYLDRPGGFAEQPLDESSLQEIARRWPQLPLEEIKDAASGYCLRRDLLSGQPTGHEMRREFDAIAGRIDGVMTDISMLQRTNRRKLIRAVASARSDTADTLVDAMNVLVRLRHDVRTAISMTPRSAPKKARHSLVEELARITREADSAGALTPLTEIILRCSGDETSRVDKLVARVLDGKKPV